MRYFSLLLFCLFSCRVIQTAQKSVVKKEVREVKVSKKKDSLHSVFTKRKKVVIEDSGRVIIYELSVPATIGAIIKGTALVKKVTVEEKKINKKINEKKEGQATVVIKQKDSSDVVAKKNETQEISTKKQPHIWSLWLWIIGIIIIIALLFFLLRRFLTPFFIWIKLLLPK